MRGQRLDTTELTLLQQIIMARTDATNITELTLLQQIIMARTGERTEARHYRADPATADHQG